MTFGFQARGGTAPSLIGLTYGRCDRSGKPLSSKSDEIDGKDEVLGPPQSVVPDQRHSTKHASKVSSNKRLVRGYRGTRASWGKRRNETIGSVASTRPTSRQALSDLMDLNLALKYNSMEKGGDAGVYHHPGAGITTSSVKPERCATGEIGEGNS